MTTSKHPHLIDLNDYPVSWWKEVVDLGEKIKNNPEVYSGACHNKIMATLFYEPSTRTQMSFQTAMLRLGGRLIGFDNPANSSVSKGETLKDTTKIVSNYADILVMRHPVAGAAKAAALSADCPVINAGDSGQTWPRCARWMEIPGAWSCGTGLPAPSRIWRFRCCPICSPPP